MLQTEFNWTGKVKTEVAMCPVGTDTSHDVMDSPNMYPTDDVTDPVTLILLKILNDLERERHAEIHRKRVERRKRREDKKLKLISEVRISKPFS